METRVPELMAVIQSQKPVSLQEPTKRYRPSQFSSERTSQAFNGPNFPFHGYNITPTITKHRPSLPSSHPSPISPLALLAGQAPLYPYLNPSNSPGSTPAITTLATTLAKCTPAGNHHPSPTLPPLTHPATATAAASTGTKYGRYRASGPPSPSLPPLVFPFRESKTAIPVFVGGRVRRRYVVDASDVSARRGRSRGCLVWRSARRCGMEARRGRRRRRREKVLLRVVLRIVRWWM